MRAVVRGVAAGCVLTIAAGAPGTATAQPFTLDAKIQPTEIKLEPYTDDATARGRMRGAVITQTEPAMYFFVQGLSIFSPDYVAVAVENPALGVNVELYKDTWDQASAGGATDARGRWNASFRTSGDFGMRVTADRRPARYALVVWSGDELNAPMPSPFTRAAAAPAVAPAASRSSPNFLLYAIVAVLVTAVVAVFFMKSKSSRNVVLIAVLGGSALIGGPAFAQGYDKAVAALLDDLKKFLQQQESVEKFWQSLKTLGQDEAVPGEAQRGPSLPSTCVDDGWALPPSPGCQCMATAVDKLRKNRQMLEKLRILVANQKTFVDKATALGNSYAQLHTMLGLQWVGIRRHDIEEPYARFKQISKQKHQALMDAIQKNLREIGTCEAKLGERDWYQKFGFMYYEFLHAAYRPAF